MTERRPKRQRTSYACLFCRSRKRKCDQSRPVCSYCLKHNSAGRCDYENSSTLVRVAVQRLLEVNNGTNDIHDASNITASPAAPFAVRPHLVNKNIIDDHSSSQEVSVLSPLSARQSTPPSKRRNTSIQSLLVDSSIDNESPKQQDIDEKETIEQLKFKLKQYQEKIVRLTDGNSENSTPLLPQIGDSDVVNFFQEDPLEIHLKVNSINEIKPLTQDYFIQCDYLYSAVLACLADNYLIMKQKLKEAKLDSNIYYLMNPLATALNEDFKTSNYIVMGKHILDKNSYYYHYNVKLFHSLCTSKQIKPSFSFYASSSNEFCAQLISEIESKLPLLEVILFLWNIFVKYVYPFIPILDLPAFKKDLELIISGLKFDIRPDEPIDLSHSNYKIYITTFIDIGHVATFLTILRISYLALKINVNFIKPNSLVENNIINSNCLQLIGPEFIDLAFLGLSQCKTMKKGSLVILIAHIFIYYYYSICEERPNGIVGNNKQILLGTIFSYAYSIGLYRDWEHSNLLYTMTGYTDTDSESKKKLVHLSRKVWHYMKRLDAREALISGFPVHSSLNKVKVPKSEKRQLSSLENIVEEDFAIEAKYNKVFCKLPKFVYDQDFTKVSDLYALWIEIDNLIKLDFPNPVQYFANNENFAENISYPSLGLINASDYKYHLMVRKILLFEKYLHLELEKFKITQLLCFHYSKKYQTKNYIYFLKQALVSITTILKVVCHQYIIQNKTFIECSTQETSDFKNFNSYLVTIVDELLGIILHFLTCLIISLFNATYLLHQQRAAYLAKEAANSTTTGTSSHVAQEISDKLTMTIILKQSLIKVLDIISRSFYQKYCRFYFFIMRSGFVFHGLLGLIKRNAKPNNTGLHSAILSVLFGANEANGCDEAANPSDTCTGSNNGNGSDNNRDIVNDTNGNSAVHSTNGIASIHENNGRMNFNDKGRSNSNNKMRRTTLSCNDEPEAPKVDKTIAPKESIWLNFCTSDIANLCRLIGIEVDANEPPLLSEIIAEYGTVSVGDNEADSGGGNLDNTDKSNGNFGNIINSNDSDMGNVNGSDFDHANLRNIQSNINNYNTNHENTDPGSSTDLNNKSASTNRNIIGKNPDWLDDIINIIDNDDLYRTFHKEITFHESRQFFLKEYILKLDKNDASA